MSATGNVGIEGLFACLSFVAFAWGKLAMDEHKRTKAIIGIGGSVILGVVAVLSIGRH